MKNLKSLLPVIVSILVITLICAATSIRNASRPIVTIFIHGSKPQLHSVFYKIGQYYFLPDLHHVDEQHSYAGPRAIIEGLKDSEYIDMEHLYFFGWSGKISAKERKIAAQNIFSQLEALVQKYRNSHSITPNIRIITHSHGGNVALNLLYELEVHASTITIDELIILAAPVQSWTKEYIKSKNCKKIYNFYSADDWIQVADPQGLQVHMNHDQVVDTPEIFEGSKRIFDHHDTLTQVQFVINHKDPGHVDFIDILYPKQLRAMFPHQFPRFLPELGNIMKIITEDPIQSHIKKTQKPIQLKIDTQKEGDERFAVYLQN